MTFQAKRISSPPNIPFDGPSHPRWLMWFAQLADVLNLPNSPGVSAITLGASPAVYQWLGGGQATIALDGNLTTKVEFSRDGVTYYTVGTNSGMYNLSQGDFLRITYTGAGPAVTLIPR